MSIINVNSAILTLARKAQKRVVGEYDVKVSLESRKADTGYYRYIQVSNPGTENQTLYVKSEADIDGIAPTDAVVMKIVFSKSHTERNQVVDKFVAQRREDGTTILSRTIHALVGLKNGRFYVYGLLNVTWRDGRPSFTEIPASELTRMGIQLPQLASAIARNGQSEATTEPVRETIAAGTDDIPAEQRDNQRKRRPSRTRISK